MQIIIDFQMMPVPSIFSLVKKNNAIRVQELIDVGGYSQVGKKVLVGNVRNSNAYIKILGWWR